MARVLRVIPPPRGVAASDLQLALRSRRFGRIDTEASVTLVTSPAVALSTLEGGSPMPKRSHANQRNALSGLRSFRTHRICVFNNQARSMISSCRSIMESSMRLELCLPQLGLGEESWSDGRSVASLDFVSSMISSSEAPCMVPTA